MLVTVLDTGKHTQERKGHKGSHSELTPLLLFPPPRKEIMQDNWWSKAQRQGVASESEKSP